MRSSAKASRWGAIHKFTWRRMQLRQHRRGGGVAGSGPRASTDSTGAAIGTETRPAGGAFRCSVDHGTAMGE